MNGRLSTRSSTARFSAIAALSLTLLFGGLFSPGVASADAGLGLTRPQPVSRDDPPPGIRPIGPGVGGTTGASTGMTGGMPRKPKVVTLPQPAGRESPVTSNPGTTSQAGGTTGTRNTATTRPANVVNSTTSGSPSSATSPQTIPNVGGGVYNTVMLFLSVLGLALIAVGSGTRLVCRRL